MKNGGINILENILADSFGVYKIDDNIQQGNNQEKYDNRQRFPDNNNFPPSSEDQMNENKLDS